jgi:hypothetical protein
MVCNKQFDNINNVSILFKSARTSMWLNNKTKKTKTPKH